MLFLVSCLVFKQVANANESEDASTYNKRPVIKETLSLSEFWKISTFTHVRL